MAIELAYINTKHPDFHRETSYVSSLTHVHMDEPAHKSQKHNKKNAIVHPSNIIFNGESPYKEVISILIDFLLLNLRENCALGENSTEDIDYRDSVYQRARCPCKLVEQLAAGR